MKKFFQVLRRTLHAGLLFLGFFVALATALQFTAVSQRVRAFLSEVPEPFSGPPTHILVMSGSRIGETGLARAFYAARVAARNPQAEILIAPSDDAPGPFAVGNVAEELRLRGVDARRIHALGPGCNTREQALHLADYVSRTPNASLRILIVTSPEHSRRTAACIRKVCSAQVAAFPHRRGRMNAARLAIRDGPGSLDAQDLALPDPGPFVHFRYVFWDNLNCSLNVVRELCAISYYRLRNWI